LSEPRFTGLEDYVLYDRFHGLFLSSCYQNMVQINLKKLSGLPRYITFFFIAFVLIYLPFPLLSIYEKQHYRVGIYQDIYRSSAIFSLLYQLVESLLLVYFGCVLKKWYWKLVPFLTAIGIECLLASIHVAVFLNGWNLFYTLFLCILSLVAFILLERYSLQKAKQTIN